MEKEVKQIQREPIGFCLLVVWFVSHLYVYLKRNVTGWFEGYLEKKEQLCISTYIAMSVLVGARERRTGER